MIFKIPMAYKSLSNPDNIMQHKHEIVFSCETQTFARAQGHWNITQENSHLTSEPG